MVKTMHIALVLALGALGVFGTMTVAYAQTSTTSQTYTELILSLGGLIAAISTVINIFASRYLAKNADSKIAKEIVNGSEYLAGTDDELIKAREDIATAIDIIEHLSPEVKKKLEEHQVDAEALRQKADAYKEEVDRARVLAEKVL